MGYSYLYTGQELASYGFPGDHPFSTERHDYFLNGVKGKDFFKNIERRLPVKAEPEEIGYFHSEKYVNAIKEYSRYGGARLDSGDTVAFPGIYEAGATVVGTALEATRKILKGSAKNAMVPIGGLHHAFRERASGFCVFNDCAVVIDFLLQEEELKQVLYVDIDAHHGDGVFYSFAADPRVINVDFHQRGIFPGTGDTSEQGSGPAEGTKLNVPLKAGATDDDFLNKWVQAKQFIQQFSPEFIILQCGADSLSGDPLTWLNLTSNVHRQVARDLLDIAKLKCQDRFLALGGGGYNLENLSLAWGAVLEEMAR